MQVTIIGAGYVGALTAITMACKNPAAYFKVCDINEKLIERWNSGELPFYEPQLADHYMKAIYQLGNIEFTTDTLSAIKSGDVVIIAVNTPPKKVN